MDLAAIPLKPFGLAKARLATAFDASERAALGRATAEHTVRVVQQAIGSVSVVTGDLEVSAWARARGANVIDEVPGRGGLNAAAGRAISAAAGGRWMIVHADLPLLTPKDVQAAWRSIPEDGFLLAPSHDGGTSVFGGVAPPPGFSYGAGSFHRHLAMLRRATLRILTRPGLLLDLDSPSDYDAALSCQQGAWLHGHDRR